MNLWKMSKNGILMETGPSYDKSFVCSDRSQNDWNKVEKYSKIGEDKKSFISKKGDYIITRLCLRFFWYFLMLRLG